MGMMGPGRPGESKLFQPEFSASASSSQSQLILSVMVERVSSLQPVLGAGVQGVMCQETSSLSVIALPAEIAQI